MTQEKQGVVGAHLVLDLNTGAPAGFSRATLDEALQVAYDLQRWSPGGAWAIVRVEATVGIKPAPPAGGPWPLSTAHGG